MVRLMRSDELWSKLRTIMRQNGVYDKPKLRLTVEGILYRMRVGCPWRDLPSYFGKWNSIYKKFNYWSKQDKLMGIFENLLKPDYTLAFIDGSFVKAHQHSTGAASDENEAIGNDVALYFVAFSIFQYWTSVDSGPPAASGVTFLPDEGYATIFASSDNSKKIFFLALNNKLTLFDY